MTERIELHEDDVETVARHMWEVEEADGRPNMAARFNDMAADDKADWMRWAIAVCAGSRTAGQVGLAAWTAACGMARVLAERRAK
jgi:hypothetical protein